MNDEHDRMLDEAAARYGASLPPIDPALDDRVMAAVRGRAAAPAPAVRPSPWRWLLEPRRIRPIWVPALAAAAAVVVWIGGREVGWGAAPAPAPVVGRLAAPDTVFVRFELVAPEARSAAVAGTFNEWSPEGLPMMRNASGTWSVTLPLPVGEHRYQFVIDGGRWQPDPSAHAEVDDGFGGRNSVIVVGPKGLVRT